MNPNMPAGGFIKPRLHMPRLHHAGAGPVALAWTSRPRVAFPKVYAVLDTDMNDLDVSRLDPSVPIAPPILDKTATLAKDNINTHGCTTLAMTNPEMFVGSSNTAYLDSGNQLPAVLQSAAALDELSATTGHLNGAVQAPK